jgi:molybdate transport system ATP-binding protein
MNLDVDVRLRPGTADIAATFAATAGAPVAILGPNGAGKTTLVAALAGILRPAAGRVVADGVVWDDVAAGTHLPAARRGVGVVFQDRLLFSHLTAIDNIAFPLRARGIGSAAARRRAGELLDRFGLSGLGGRLPSALSGGEAQRVALARALAGDPRLLLLDEPLAALDVRTRAETRRLLKETIAGFPGVVLLVTHDPVEAMTLAGRVIVLEEGRVTQIGDPEEIRRSPRTAWIADLAGVNLYAGRLERIDAGSARLALPAGGIIVALPRDRELPADGAVAVIRPADVAIHTVAPVGSPRNVLEGPIASILLDGERARVRVGSTPAVVAEITAASVARLELREGVRVWATFKAVEAQVQEA